MGRVYLGRSAGGQLVAVKVIRRETAGDPLFRARFTQEVAAARRVNGLYTAHVVDADTDGPEPWLATAYIDAPSLDMKVRNGGPLSHEGVRGLATALAEGLSKIHATGLVHRDLKPSNVLLAHDGPRIIDFGIAWSAEAISLTHSDGVVGTPSYMSPEQARGNTVGPPSDVFSLGAVIYYMATGETLWGRGTTEAILYRVVHEPPILSKDLPAGLRSIVTRCLAKDPGERPTPTQILGELGDRELMGDGIPAPFKTAPGGLRSRTPHPSVAAPDDVPWPSTVSVPRADAAPRQSRQPQARPIPSAPPAPNDPGAADNRRPVHAPGQPGAERADRVGPAEHANRRPGPFRQHGRRWLILAGVIVAAAAAGGTAVLLTPGHHVIALSHQSGQGSHSATGFATVPLTATQARSVLAGYTKSNNDANAQRNDTLLATIETGSSYAIDAALYRSQRAAGTAPYPAFSPAKATYYIPRGESATGPRWFIVQIANAFTADPGKVTSNEYMLFTQSTPGSAWRDAVEPYLLAGVSAPQVTVGADGLATAVSADATAATVAPGQLPAMTAASLDGTGTGTGTGQAIADPGNLTDETDQFHWQGDVPGGVVTDAHGPAPGADGQEFALLTVGGGALVFYTDAAEVTITPPSGSALRLTIPGLYSASQTVSRAGLSYLEQFATYDPPPGNGAPRVVADYSGLTGKN